MNLKLSLETEYGVRCGKVRVEGAEVAKLGGCKEQKDRRVVVSGREK